jgi:hypothetical protein
LKAVIVTLALGLLAVAVADSSAAVAAKPAGEWHLDEGRGTTVKDSSANHNDGTILSGTSWTQGRFGSALSFDGSKGRVLVRDNLALEPDSAVTVSAWVRSAASPGDYRYIVAKGASRCTTASYGLYSGPDGGLMFYVSKDRGTGFVRSPDAGTRVWDGGWHLAVGTFDGTFVRLYVDGRQVGRGTRREGQLEYRFENSNDLFIGDYPSCQPATFAGMIDEVSIWREALTADEIKADYDRAVGQDTGQSPGGAGGGGGSGVTPGQAPSILHLSVSPSAFRLGPGRSGRAGRTGATISYTDTKAARSTFTVLARQAGIKVHGRCVAPSRHRSGRHATRCSYYKRVGTFTHTDVAGHNSFRFVRLRGHRLTPGKHRLDATPRAGGLVGRTISVTFVVKR